MAREGVAVERIDLEQIERNVFRDYLQDGLSDMLMGAYFLLVGLALPVGTVAPFVVLPVLFFAPLLRGLKERFTGPRTGYVKLREGDPQALPWFVLGSLVLGLAALAGVLMARGIIARPGRWYRWMPIFFGTWLGGILLGLGLRVGVARYYVLAVVALVMGPISTLAPMAGKLENIGLFFAALGDVWLAWGVVTSAHFLREYPVATEGFSNATE